MLEANNLPPLRQPCQHPFSNVNIAAHDRPFAATPQFAQQGKPMICSLVGSRIDAKKHQLFGGFMGKRAWLFTVCLFALASCGGGGGSGSGRSDTPAPTSPPSPPAPPPPTTGASFSAAAIGPFIGHIIFDADGNGAFQSSGDIEVFTNRAGQFGRGVTGRVDPTPLRTEPPLQPLFRMRAHGVDAATGFSYTMHAPVGATVVSPLTTLIYVANDMFGIREALGLNDGSAALRSSTDLLTFDAVNGLRSNDAAIRQDAGRITSINVQLLNLALIASDFPHSPIDAGHGLTGPMQRLAQVVDETGSIRFDDPDTILRILQRMPSPQPNLEQLQVAAGLIAKYGSIVPERIDDPRTAVAYGNLFRFFIVPHVLRIYREYPSPDLERVRAITAGDIEAQLPIFSNLPPPDVSGSFVAAPDYREFVAPVVTLERCDFPTLQLPFCNDARIGRESGIARDDYSMVSVQSGSNSRLHVNLTADGKVFIESVNGYRGYTFFDYRARTRSGAESTSRVYVFIEDEPSE